MSVIFILFCLGCFGLFGVSESKNALINGSIICKEGTKDYSSFPVTIRLFDNRGVLNWKESCTANTNGEFFFNISSEVRNGCRDCFGEVGIGNADHKFTMGDQVVLELYVDDLSYAKYVFAYLNKYCNPILAYYLGLAMVAVLYQALQRRRQSKPKHNVGCTREQRVSFATDQQHQLMRQPNVQSTTTIVE